MKLPIKYKTGAKYTISPSSTIYNFVSQELEIYRGGQLEYIGPIRIGNIEAFPVFKLVKESAAIRYIMPINCCAEVLGGA